MVVSTQIKVTNITCSISIITNSLIFYFILFKTPANLKRYSIVIFAYTLADFFLSVPSVILHPFLFTVDNALIVEYYGIGQRLGVEFCNLIYIFICCGYCSLICFTAAGFGFRYYSLRYLKNVSTRNTVIICVLLWIIAECAATFLFLITAASPEESEKVMVKYKTIPRNDNEEHLYHVLGGLDSPLMVYYWSSYTPAAAVSFIAILWLRQQVVKEFLKKAMQLSPVTARIHKQMLRTLTVQSITPFLIFVICILGIIGQFFYRNEWMTFAMFTCIDTFIIVNPLSTLFFIKTYRHALLNMSCVKVAEGSTFQVAPSGGKVENIAGNPAALARA